MEMDQQLVEESKEMAENTGLDPPNAKRRKTSSSSSSPTRPGKDNDIGPQNGGSVNNSDHLGSFLDLPIDSRVRILEYCTVWDLAEYACVSKTCREDCRDDNHLLPRERWGTLNVRSIDAITKLEEYRQKSAGTRLSCLKIQNINRLSKIPIQTLKLYFRVVGKLLNVKKLDLSLMPYSSTTLPKNKKGRKIPTCIAIHLSKAMPSLREVDLSFVDVTQTAISHFANHCPQLELFIWRFSDGNVMASGQDFRVSNGRTFRHDSCIREVYMDDSKFWIDSRERWEVLGREDQGPGCFLFEFLRDTLQRLSIRNCSIRVFGEKANPPNPITQSTLCKMVRGLPHLTWLQSDLNTESIAMLQVERPDMVFVGSTIPTEQSTKK